MQLRACRGRIVRGWLAEAYVITVWIGFHALGKLAVDAQLCACRKLCVGDGSDEARVGLHNAGAGPPTSREIAVVAAISEGW